MFPITHASKLCGVAILTVRKFFSVKYFSRYEPKLFDEFPQRGYDNGFSMDVKRGDAFQALDSFRRLNESGTKPKKYLLCTVINFCAKTLNLCLGLQVHARLVRSGHEDNMILCSALVDLYAKCGSIIDAKRVFNGMIKHDEVSWTSIIAGFSQNGCGREALLMFKQMLVTEIKPNCSTYASVISACTGLEEAFESCRLLHGNVIKLRLNTNTFVLSSLVDCYSKCGKIDYAKLLFDESAARDDSVFTSMISGCSQNQFSEEALRLFMEMRDCNVDPSDHTLTCILNACGNLTNLRQGKQVHGLITKMGSDGNVFVVTALTDMYSKCGGVYEARQIFDQTVAKNVVLWTSMIMGYAQNGQARDALELFECFLNETGYRPDHICFTAVLTACNHAGLLEEGTKYFDMMRRVYGLVPEIDQYACLIDLYARNGHLSEAKKLIKEMPYKPNDVIWSSLLSSCKVYGDVELAKEAANQLFKVEPKSAAPYSVLASLYAKAGLWNEVAEVRKLMQQKGMKKGAGWSWVEVDQKVNIFSVGDDTHPQAKDIYAELEKLNLEIKEVGYITKQQCELDDTKF